MEEAGRNIVLTVGKDGGLSPRYALGAERKSTAQEQWKGADSPLALTLFPRERQTAGDRS